MHGIRDRAQESGFFAFLDARAAPPDKAKLDELRRQGATYADVMNAGLVPGAELADAIAEFHQLPRADPDRISDLPDRLDGLSRRYLREAAIFPFEEEGELILAVGDPTHQDAIGAVAVALERRAAIQIAGFDEIAALFEQRAEQAARSEVAEHDEPPRNGRATHVEDNVDLLQDLATGAPVIRAVDTMIETAVDLGATDIHIEPQREGIRVRMRVDGLLRPYQALGDEMARAIVSRVKILAGLDIAERRLPQDGRARIFVSAREVDLRIATMPSVDGEAAVIRILAREGTVQELGRLGMGKADFQAFASALAEPHGMIIVCGPTGSGKTTTLAAALARLNDPQRKILTIEDPIEYQIRGIHQTQVKPSIGLTFATALRSYLRHDPDIIMVGEMRDTETASIGVQAAITGHLVLTTLHTNSAVDTVARLIDMDVEPFLLASALRCVVGQRLVRKLCERCKVPLSHDAIENLRSDPRLREFSIESVLYAPNGCQWCGGTGYRGRIGIFEVLTIDDRVRSTIRHNVDTAAIEAAAEASGMTEMLSDGFAKCAAGMTSVDEVLRVTV